MHKRKVKDKVSVRIPPELGEQIERAVREGGVSDADLIRTGLILLFQKHKTPDSIAEAIFRTSRLIKFQAGRGS